jgi:hypothetical protein
MNNFWWVGGLSHGRSVLAEKRIAASTIEFSTDVRAPSAPDDLLVISPGAATSCRDWARRLG